MQTGFLAGPTLRFMDWIGNARHGVALPYNYWSAQEWTLALQRVSTGPIETWKDLTSASIPGRHLPCSTDRLILWRALGAGPALRPT